MKQRIRLTKSDLHKIIKESVCKILKEGKYDFEYNAFRDKNTDDCMYLQVAMMGSPESYELYGGDEVVTNGYKKAYETLCSESPEKVLSLWRKMKINSDVTSYYQSNDKFQVEEDSDGVYLMIRIDNEEDIPKYQEGNW